MNFYSLVFLFFPIPGVFLLILGLGFLKGRGRAFCTGLGMAILVFLAFPVTSKLLVLPLLVHGQSLVEIIDSRPDVILVPTGGVRQVGDADYVPKEHTMARITHAKHLQDVLQIPMIVSGGDVKGIGTSESAIAVKAVQLEADKVILDQKAMNTAQNVDAFVEIMKQNGLSRPVVATDAVHTRRVAATLLAHGVSAALSPAWEDVATPITPQDFVPSRIGYRYANRVAIAYAAILKYLAQGHFQWGHLTAIK
ncbi:YdcF family protein [Aestuariispira ectoiniformans]|uniref:YdcF family protein n=1 Tax=Aestuariispira ectoiniformans TaxID=2775080 RepID=UPI00223BD2BF|nr:YdcF family protein [Aestuariispira ectoiniformans]